MEILVCFSADAVPFSEDGRWLIGLGVYFTIVALVLLAMIPAAAGISGIGIILGAPFSALFGLLFSFLGWRKARRWTRSRFLTTLGRIVMLINGAIILAFLGVFLWHLLT